MVGFIDEHRERFGLEPICAVLPIAPSLYYELKARQRDPDRRPARERRDETLGEHIAPVWRENREVYGVRKVWKPLRREGQAGMLDGETRWKGLNVHWRTLPCFAARRCARMHGEREDGGGPRRDPS